MASGQQLVALLRLRNALTEDVTDRVNRPGHVMQYEHAHEPSPDECG